MMCQQSVVMYQSEMDRGVISLNVLKVIEQNSTHLSHYRGQCNVVGNVNFCCFCRVPWILVDTHQQQAHQYHRQESPLFRSSVHFLAILLMS